MVLLYTILAIPVLFFSLLNPHDPDYQKPLSAILFVVSILTIVQVDRRLSRAEVPGRSVLVLGVGASFLYALVVVPFNAAYWMGY